MEILDQKLGSVGDVHIAIVSGKLVIGVDGDVDLVQALEALRGAHQADLLGTLLTAAEKGIVALTSAAAPAAAVEAKV